MRSGKTFFGGFCASYDLFRLFVTNPWKLYFLAPGSKITILVVAGKMRQGEDSIYAEACARIRSNPFFDQFDYEILKNEVKFYDPPYNLIKIKNISSKAFTEVGTTAFMAVLDELNKMEDTGGHLSGEHMYELVRKSTSSFAAWNEDSKIVISSPLWEGDPLDRIITRAREVNNPKVIIWVTNTWEVSSVHTEEMLEEERKRNPETFARDFGGQTITKLTDYFKQKDKLYVNEKRENWLAWDEDAQDWSLSLPRQLPRGGFVLSGDQALQNDSFGITLLHSERISDGKRRYRIFVADILYRMTGRAAKSKHKGMYQTEVSPGKVNSLFKLLLKRLSIEKVVFDTWNFPGTIELCERILGSENVIINIVKKQEYDYLKERFYVEPKEIDLCNNDYVIKELKHLMLVRGQKIDHPRSGSKDLADSLCNAVWVKSGKYEEEERLRKLDSNPSGLVYVKGANPSGFRFPSMVRKNYFPAYIRKNSSRYIRGRKRW